MTILNDMTYQNIWSNFSRWIVEQSEQGHTLNVFPFGNFVYVSEKPNNGICLKISDSYLKEYDLKWDDSRLNIDRITRKDFSSAIQTQKLNIVSIGAELNIPKVYIQNGLNNLFSSIMDLLSSNSLCVIELGQLGNLYSNNREVFHLPVKFKKDGFINKKCTVKSLMISQRFDINDEKAYYGNEGMCFNANFDLIFNL